ncbi:hypothetical protein V6N12_013991 [Hibiscus sabdariffa]|uniref:Uncharacterized protein n=1 Tax=Hibiscus sabdariffa TaxID=183260 RepID=A0ABR2BFW8_9ROSI
MLQHSRHPILHGINATASSPFHSTLSTSSSLHRKQTTNHLPQAISAEIIHQRPRLLTVLSHPQTQVVACPQAMEQKNGIAKIRSQDMFMAEIHPSEYKAATY